MRGGTDSRTPTMHKPVMTRVMNMASKFIPTGMPKRTGALESRAPIVENGGTVDGPRLGLHEDVELAVQAQALVGGRKIGGGCNMCASRG